MPSFSVYRDAITPRRAPQAGDLVFTRLDHLSGLSEGRSDLRLTVVYRRGGIVLLTADAADD